MSKDFWSDLGLTEQEINSLNFVKDVASFSQRAHVKGREFKQIDKLAADVVNSREFRIAWSKIHQAEQQVPISEVDY